MFFLYNECVEGINNNIYGGIFMRKNKILAGLLCSTLTLSSVMEKERHGH